MIFFFPPPPFFLLLNFIPGLLGRCLPPFFFSFFVDISRSSIHNTLRIITLMPTIFGQFFIIGSTDSRNNRPRSYILSYLFPILSRFFLSLALSHNIHVYIYFFVHALVSRRLVIFYWGNRKSCVQGNVIQASRNVVLSKKKRKWSNWKFGFVFFFLILLFCWNFQYFRALQFVIRIFPSPFSFFLSRSQKYSSDPINTFRIQPCTYSLRITRTIIMLYIYNYIYIYIYLYL